MINSQPRLKFNSSPSPSLSLLPRPPVFNLPSTTLPVLAGCHFQKRLHTNLQIHAANSSNAKMTSTVNPVQKTVSVKALVTVTVTSGGLTQPLDDLIDLTGKTLLLELVSAEIDPNTGLEREAIKGYAHKVSQKDDEVKYETKFVVPADFGEVGAVQVENEHHKEIYLQNIVLDGFPDGQVHVSCNSWVHSKNDNPIKRVFFTDKSYLPSETPSGLRRLRETELEILRGNGKGERKTFERIYDYDSYNDLADPDTSSDLARPVLGTKDLPYPRRCRTGRPHCKTDPLSEQRSDNIYVPRDEAFAAAATLKSVLKALMKIIQTIFPDPKLGFENLAAIDSLFSEGVKLPNESGFLQSLLPRLVKAITDGKESLLLFDTPEMIARDKFSWFKDEEFARQTLAGLNPYSIQLVTGWPLKSKLDPKIYGPAESLITTELVEQAIGSTMTVNEALKRKRLFMLDYHDLLLPYVNKVREIEGSTLYGSRTLFFLTKEGTLTPIAIELTRPPTGDKPQWKQVFTPGWDNSSRWLWRLAKTHVSAHDVFYHELVIHWLRTHSCAEPYVIAANRHLSAMHPIYRLLHPHFRHTLEINSVARALLTNAGGLIETCYTPAKYSNEITSDVYDQRWRFDMEALPADLIRRGMAVEDPTAKHGLRLTIEDYPFANDGLVLWDAIKQWVSEYVNHYYPKPSTVESDKELQAFWTEVRTKGHADKKDEPWWPVLKTPDDLIQILTTIIWVTAGHHSAVNFGMYPFAGYFPNRPTIVRTKMPTEDTSEDEFKTFLKKPEDELLKCLPSKIQATKMTAFLYVISSHTTDEEYLGENIEPSWAGNPVIKAAFERFNGRLKKLEEIIDERNDNLNLKNRVGAGVVPYELLKPFSEPGVTGKGVPNSISI